MTAHLPAELAPVPTTQRILPAVLRIVPPPLDQHRDLSTAYISCAQHILFQPSYGLLLGEQPSSCMASGGSKSWQLPSPLRRRKRGTSQEEGFHEGGEGSPEPPSPSPTTSSFRTWPNLRRVASASTPGSPSISSPHDTSPISPSAKMHRRPSRLSSFIRRHHSATAAAVGDETIPQSLRPRIQPPQTYIPYSQPLQSVRSGPQHRPSPPSLSTSLPPPIPFYSPGFNNAPSFSPVARNPYESWQIHRRPHTAFSSPGGYTMEQSPQTLNPLRGFSNSSAPATTTSSRPTRILDTAFKLEGESEPFTSPSDFALFAEATNSVSFLPPTSAVLEHQPADLDFQSHTLPMPSVSPSLLAPMPFYDTPRARSVPPSESHSHVHSPSIPHSHHPLPIHRSAAAAAATIRPQPSRTQLIAEALTGVGDDGSEHGSEDDELPDYATSQAEASAQKRQGATRRARELEESWRRGRAERSRWG